MGEYSNRKWCYLKIFYRLFPDDYHCLITQIKEILYNTLQNAGIGNYFENSSEHSLMNKALF